MKFANTIYSVLLELHSHHKDKHKLAKNFKFLIACVSLVHREKVYEMRSFGQDGKQNWERNKNYRGDGCTWTQVKLHPIP